MTPNLAGSPGQAAPRKALIFSLHTASSDPSPLQGLALFLRSLVLVRKCVIRACCLHHPSAVWRRRGIPGKPSPVHPQASLLFLLLICSLSLARESASSGKAGMSLLNFVYLLALGCESTPRQLHINLVSSLYLFSSALLPWPNLWLSFPWLPIVTVTGGSLFWVLRPQTGARSVLISVIQSPAICVTGINLDQALPHLLTSYHMLWLCLEKSRQRGELGKLDPGFQWRRHGVAGRHYGQHVYFNCSTIDSNSTGLRIQTKWVLIPAQTLSICVMICVSIYNEHVNYPPLNLSVLIFKISEIISTPQNN